MSRATTAPGHARLDATSQQASRWLAGTHRQDRPAPRWQSGERGDQDADGDTAESPLPEAPPTPPPLVSVVIPARNEGRRLPEILARIPADVHEVIIVDGYSLDGTSEIARELRPDVTIVRQNRPGRGNALAWGLAEATGDVIVTLDVDRCTDPAQIPLFVAALLEGLDYVKGSRFAGRAWGASSARHRWINRLASALYGTSFTDVGCGFAAFWRSSLPSLQLQLPSGAVGGHWGDGPELDAIIAVRMARAGARMREMRGSAAGGPAEPAGSVSGATITRLLGAVLSERLRRADRPGRRPIARGRDPESGTAMRGDSRTPAP